MLKDSKVKRIVDVNDAGEKVNILLVDDRVENLIALKAILSPLGQNIVEARSGREALRHLLERDFAVVLLDVMMPNMDGFETAELIRAREKSRLTPIIFVTAMFIEELHIFRGYAVGAVDYITKPFLPDVLRSKVSVFAELFKKSEQLKRQAEVIREIEQREFESRLTEAQLVIERETERVQVEQRIAQALMRHAPVGIVRMDKNLAIVEVNPLFRQQFQCDIELEKEQMVTEALPWLPETFVQALKSGQASRLDAIRVLPSDECSEPCDRYWDLASWPIKDGLGNVVGTVLVSIDVTERVQLEIQRKDFVGTLAHDLQTPVIASDRALEVLLSRLANQIEPDLKNLIAMLKRNNQNLLHMIQSLLDIYHYEMGAKALHFNNVEVAGLVQSCIEELSSLALENELSFKFTSNGDDVTIAADRTGLRRVITNLLDNAIKYSPKGGIIDVSIGKRDGSLLLEVMNEGVGISKDDQPHLFKRFWHTSQSKGYKASSGLGLYLCRQIVQAHRGGIECDSEPGKTTRFAVKLPVVQFPDQANVAASEQEKMLSEAHH
jgi:signal transduction histidine kinase